MFFAFYKNNRKKNPRLPGQTGKLCQLFFWNQSLEQDAKAKCMVVPSTVTGSIDSLVIAVFKSNFLVCNAATKIPTKDEAIVTGAAVIQSWFQPSVGPVIGEMLKSPALNL